ncbi:hypothetical protein JTE90_015444 [Oedothorax gibbosus]|uniref:Uncharacterized protein n=1 Tax=Oedothorax gibbosus TaxID=931172 RepID=A0AAV6TGG0_9ARAC|nr:hypothetical protein JTE90_015444 [Oedothorax gibbosus]
MLTCARVNGVLKSARRRNEVTGRRRWRIGIPVPSRAGRTGVDRRVSQLVEVAEVSAHVGTRTKDGENYARDHGRGQRKLWWRSVAVLTCNRSSDLGSSGVRD